MKFRRFRDRWRHRRQRRADSGEICHHADCLRDLTYGELFQSRHDLANTAEMGGAGGTYLTGYWCREHAPDDAVPWSP